MLKRLFDSFGWFFVLISGLLSACAIDDIGPTNRVWLQGTSPTISGGFQNAGTLLLESIDDAYDVDLTVPQGAVTNLASGLIEFLGGAGGGRSFTADVINYGNFDASYGLVMTKTNGLFHQRGLFNVATNIPCYYYCTNGYFFQEAGWLTITGRFQMHQATFVYSGGIITGEPLLVDAALQLLSSATNEASFQINATTSQLLGDVPGGQTVRILGSNENGPGYLTSTNGFRNEGVLYLDATNAPFDAGLIVLAGAITNSTTGVIYSRAGPGGAREIQSDLFNAGQLINETALTVKAPRAGVVNAGHMFLTSDQFLTLNSDFTQTASGTLKLELSQPDPGFDTEFMTIGGTAALDGQLVLALKPDYTPLPGDSFRVLSCQRRVGYFNLTDVASLPPGLAWKVDYRNNAVILSVNNKVQPPVVQEVTRVAGGSIHLTCTGTPSGALVLQSSPDFKSWSAVATNRPFRGLFEFTDSSTKTVAKRFYRAVAVP
ncbi:MAG: hypothetical protein HY043_04555 [Verrucomicrobia bacterium]|nr:hypothetical protein [Verrucomicrobiota bacterium]